MGWDEARSVEAFVDGGLAVAGLIRSVRGDADIWLLRLDTAGNVVWERTIGGAGIDVPTSVATLDDGTLAVVGWTDSRGAGGNDIWLLRLDIAGNVVWERTFGGAGDDFSGSVVELADGGLVVAGYRFERCRRSRRLGAPAGWGGQNIVGAHFRWHGR